MPKTHHSMVWAGTDLAFELYMAARQKFANSTPAQAGVVLSPDNDPEKPKTTDASGKYQPKSRLLQVEGGVALISVAGVLTSENNWWNQYAGLVAYDEIKEAIHEAAGSGATQALVYFNTPGGSVAGLKDAVDTLTAFSKVMPTYGYTDSMATSAGYWLMSATRKRYASEVAVVGSIGVIAKHFEYSKMLEMDGIAATVIRAGEFKALASEVEPLSKKAHDGIQADVNYLYGVFVGSVAEQLNTSYQMVDSKMAQGRTFIGAQAVEVGLVDGVSSFDALYASLLKKVDKAAQTGGSPMKKKYANMAAVMAAASAGVPLGELEVDETAGAEAVAGVVDPTDVAPAQAAPEASEGGGTPAAGEGGGTQEPAATVGAVDDSAVVAMLKGQLAEASEAAVVAKAEALNAKKALDEMAASAAPLQAIVAGSINNMLVALGGTADSSLAGADAKTLLARHAAVSEDFTKNFKIGGVASAKADGDVEKKPETPAMSEMDQARLRLVKPAHNTK